MGTGTPARAGRRIDHAERPFADGRTRLRRDRRAVRVARLAGGLRRAIAGPRHRIRSGMQPVWTILIPAYNEHAGLPVMVTRLRRVIDRRYEVIVVDDGSTDGTASVARSCGLRVIKHDVNQGKAAAVRTGVAAARGRDVILIDADDTYPVEDIPRVAAMLESHEYVVGVRTSGRQNISMFNRLGNDGFRMLISWVAGARLGDPLSGLYGVRRAALDQMGLRSLGFAIEAEIAIKAGRGGLTYAELPIEYGPRVGTSKLNPIRDGMLILREALAHRHWRGIRMTSPQTVSRD